jgi:hypothetical protein
MERALRFLDSLDSAVDALRFAWIGYPGRRIRALLISLIIGMAMLTVSVSHLGGVSVAAPGGVSAGLEKAVP